MGKYIWLGEGLQDKCILSGEGLLIGCGQVNSK